MNFFRGVMWAMVFSVPIWVAIVQMIRRLLSPDSMKPPA